MGRLIATSNMSVRYMTAGVDANRFDPFIVEAEELDIRPFLGDALFKDMVDGLASSPQEEIYTDLLNGKTYTCGSYTIDFKGLSQALQYYAYARYLGNSDITHVKTGAVVLDGEFSQRPTKVDIQRKIDQARSSAGTFLEDARKFLNEKSTTYPLWNCNGDVRRGGAVLKIL